MRVTHYLNWRRLITTAAAAAAPTMGIRRCRRPQKIADDGGDDAVAAVMVWDQGGQFYTPLALDARMRVFRGPRDRYWLSNWTAAEEAETLASSV